MSSPLSRDLFSDASVKSLKEMHDNASPFSHVVIDQLCEVDRMTRVQSEAKNNLTANFKETDLFKVFQTGELGNFDAADPDTAAKYPELLNLRNAIYSDSFRAFVARVMGVGDLTDRVDCSCNAYTQGCHLICHDDVIGTRRISYIIYLTDPDPEDEWTSEDGGALELYPIDEGSRVALGQAGSMSFQGIPTAEPTTRILPTFNSMAMFRVQPGRSYHSVQEVYTGGKPRLSISGWFHGPDPPVGADLASLKQIMTRGDDQRPFKPFSEVAPGTSQPSKKPRGIGKASKSDDMPPADLEVLSRWVNPMFLGKKAIKNINKKFCVDSSIQLKDFIKEEVAYRLSSLTKQADTADRLGSGRVPSSYQVGATGGEGSTGLDWKLVGPAHKRRHLLLTETDRTAAGGKRSLANDVQPKDDAGAAGSLLMEIQRSLFATAAFARYLTRLTSLEPTGYRDEIRRFRPGLDYTVAHFGAMTKVPRLDATLCFVHGGDKKNDDEEEDEEEEDEDEDDEDDDEEDDDEEDAWEGGDVGGYECYIAADPNADEDLEAAEVFEQEKEDDEAVGGEEEEEEEEEEEDQLLSISAGCNVLSLVMRNENIMRFIKYVGSNAPGSRWDITMDYEIVVEEEEEEEDGDGDDEDGDDDGNDEGDDDNDGNDEDEGGEEGNDGDSDAEEAR